MRLNSALSALLVAAFLTGCVETIVMDPHEEDLPVMVSCVLETGQLKQTLYLQYVKGKSQEAYLPVEDAKVYIVEAAGQNNKTIEFHHLSGSVWETRESPFDIIKPEMTYRLYVEIPGRDVIKAETTVPSNRIIPQVVKYIKDRPQETVVEKYDDIYFRVDAPDGVQTVPVWIFAVKGKHADDEGTENRYPLLVTDHPHADLFNISELKFTDLEIEGGPDPSDTHLTMSWPVFKEMPRRMPNLPLFEGFIRISRFGDDSFHLLAGPLKYRESYQDHFDFYFVSDEYDSYMRSIYIKNHRMEIDLTSLFTIENSYSNIEGGVGVFGGVSKNNLMFLVN